MMDLVACNSIDITYEDRCAISRLIGETWPAQNIDVVNVDMEIEKYFNSQPEEMHAYVKLDGSVVAYAKSFLRNVKIFDKITRNMALACVCVKKEQRKNGFGTLIVKKLFESVDNGCFECSIFQTAVPQFYEKMGVRRIANECIDSQNNNQNPWWDPNVMLYPANFEIGDGVIDLLGKGY